MSRRGLRLTNWLTHAYSRGYHSGKADFSGLIEWLLRVYRQGSPNASQCLYEVEVVVDPAHVLLSVVRAVCKVFEDAHRVSVTWPGAR